MVDLRTFGVAKGEGKYHEEIVYSIALLYNIISSDMTNFLKDYDLTIGKLNILIVIKNHGKEKGISQVDISNYLIVTAANMTKMIDKLEKDGLVERSALDGDRRVKIIRITKKGTNLLDLLWEGYNARIKESTKYLKKDQQKQLSGLLLEWLENIR